MLVIYALLFLEPLGNETRSLITDQRINSVVPIEENLIQGASFVALAKLVEEVSQTETTDKKSRNASTVTNLDILQGAVPSEETPQLQSAPQRFMIQERHSDISMTEKDEVKLSI